MYDSGRLSAVIPFQTRGKYLTVSTVVISEPSGTGSSTEVVVTNPPAPIASVTPSPVQLTTKGEKGDRGLQGLPGEPGGAIAGTGDLNYDHFQASGSDTWVIVHNLNKRPAVVVIDSGGNECEGSVSYDSANQITITFSAAFGGHAYLN